MSFRRTVRPREARRRWPLLLAYAALVVSCDSQLAPNALGIERVEVTPSVAELVPGGTQTVTARVYNTEGAQVTERRVFWSSQNPAVATVTQAGVITAVGTGTTQVAASSGGRSGTVAVTVQPRPVALMRVTPSATNVVAGATVRLTAEPLDGTGAVIPGRVVAWSTGDAGIATVDNSGLVTGVSPGTVTIRATAGGIDGTASVTVVPAPIASIDLAPGVFSLNVGESTPLAATPRDAGGQALTGRQLTWSSSDNGIATVSSLGVVTGIASGTATITVSAPGAGPGGSTPSRTAQVTVLLPAVARVQVAPAAASVSIGGTTNFAVSLFDANDQPLGTAGRVVAWTSSNTAVATINGVSGVATGVATGTTTITATVSTPGRPGSQQGTATLTVSNVPVATVTVSPNPAVVHAGAPYARAFSAVLKDAQGNTLSGRTVVWTSSNQSIATVDGNTGVVTGVAPGTSRIRAVSEGKEGFVDATIDLVAISTVQVTPPTASLVPPQTTQLGAVPRDSAGNVINGAALGSRTPAWSSDNAAVASVNTSGLVTAVSPGTATVTGAFGAIVGQSVITVSAVPVGSVTVTPPAPSVTVGQTVLLTASAFSAGGAPLTGRTFTWTSANSAIASVDQTGLVTGVAAGGPVRIIVSAEGKADTADVTVTPRPATKLGMAVQPPASAQSGVPLTVQPAVQLFDVTNAPVAQAGVVVTAAIGSGSGTLSGTLTASTNSSGVATFTNLVLTGVAGSNTLAFSASGLTGVTSSAIVLGAGGPSKLGMVQQPSATAQSGVQLTQQPSVRLLDASDNPVSQANVVITASLVGATGSLAGTLQATTNGSGVAAFTALAVSGPVPGPYTLQFTASGLTAATSNGITLSPGPASQLAMHTQPSATAQSGAPFGTPPAVRLKDAAGNNVSAAGVVVTVTLNGSGGTLGGTASATTDASGIATFSGLSISGTVGSYTLTFASAPLSSITSNSIAVGAGAASQFTITSQPSSSATNDVAFAQQPVLQLRDAAGNAVAQSGVPVTATIASGGPALGGTTTVTTNASGVAAFTNLKITGTVGARTLQFASAHPTVTSNAINVIAGAATQLVITTAPSTTASSGAALAQQPVLQLRDISGNDVPQSGVAVTASLPGGSAATLAGETVGTNASGTAAFTALTLTGSAGNYTLTFAAGALTVQAAPIALSAGTGSKLAIVTQPSASSPNGAVFAQQPVVRLLDASDNPVLQAGVAVSVTIATGSPALNGTTSVMTDASGVATFTTLSITGTVGARTLIFASSGYISVSSNAITITPGAATALAIATQPSSTAQSGVSFVQQPAVQIVDGSGNAVSQAGVVVTAAVASGAGALGGTTAATTNTSGVATFSDLQITGLAGNHTLSFSSTSPALASPASNTIALGAGTPTQLTITTQPSATATNDVAFAQQPVVQVRDGAGNAVNQAGVSISAAILSGGGTLGGTTTVASNASGAATFTDLKITGTTGSRTLQFTSGSLTAVTSNAINVAAGAATQLVLVTAPSATASSGTALAQQPVLQLRDASGNDVPQGGATVSATIATGTGASLSGASVTTSASGTATFTALTLTGTAGNFTLSFAAGALTVNSGTIALGAGTATTLVISTPPPASAQNGAPLSPQPVIQLQDASGNPVSQAGVAVTAAIASGGGSLGGATTVATNASGTAAFTDLSITGTVGDRTLAFTAPSLAGATSGTISVTAGAAAALALTTQPSSSVQVGIAFPTQPVLQIQDASGNPVSQAGTVVTAAIASGGGSLGGTTTATTNGSGAATFSDLQISGSVGDRTLSFSAGSLTPATSNTISVGPAAASQITITTQPSTAATNGAPFAQQPVLQLRDASGNAVSQSGVTVTAAIASGGGTLGGTTAVNTDASGAATFTNLTITGPAGDHTLSFSASGLTGATSGTIAVAPGAATTLAIATQPSATAANAAPFAQQPVVRLQDASGNPVSQAGVNVTAAIAAPGAGTLGGTATVATDASGTATFTDLAITGTVGSYSLDFTATALTGATSNAITLTAGAPNTVSVTAPRDSIIGTATLQATATILDSGGNTVTSVSPTWSSSDPAVATVDGSSGLITGVTPGNATITATAGGKSGNLSVRVLAAVATVEVTATDSSLYAGQTVQATVVLKDGNGNTITGRPVAWSSSNAAKATVDATTGFVTAVDSGTATITASVPAEGKSGSFPLAVALVPADSVLVSPTTAALTVGDTLTFSAVAYDSTGAVLAGRAFTWSVTDAAKASISTSGKLTALDSGTVVVTATTTPGTSAGSRSDSTTLTISLVPIDSLGLSDTARTIPASQMHPFVVTAYGPAPTRALLAGRLCTAASSDTNVATVSPASGLTDSLGTFTVNATVPAGATPSATATLTFTCEGKQRTATVTVQ